MSARRTASDIVPPTTLWTWADYESVRFGEHLLEVPAHWPTDATVSRTRWAHWLPPDWGQAVRIRPSDGVEKTTFISPEGRSFDNRTAAEKAMGEKFPDGYNPPEWPDWLEKDWAHAEIDQASRKARIFIPPSGDRYFWNRGDFEKRQPSGSPITLSDEVLKPWQDWQRRNGYLRDGKEAEEPATKKQKVEQGGETNVLQPCSFGEETDNEIGNIDVSSLPDNTSYDLRICRNGSAWIALPHNVLHVSLDWISSRFTKAGWSLASKTESRAVFSARGNTPHVAFYCDKGKLLMKTRDAAKASKVAELYDNWLNEVGEDRE